MIKFKKNVTVIVTALNESSSLKETIKILIRDNNESLDKIIISSCQNRASSKCLITMSELVNIYGDLIELKFQSGKGVGNAILDSLPHVSTKYFVFMASDLETNPKYVKKMVKSALETNCDVVSCSRWLSKGLFEGYNPVKLFLNWFFQKKLQFITGSNITDFTYGFRLYKTEMFKGLSLQENSHAFFLESLLIPALKKYSIVEIPTSWKARGESSSTFHIIQYFQYLVIVYKSILRVDRN